MKKQRGLEVAHRLVIHVKKPCTITVTAKGKRRMLADAPLDAAEFEEQKPGKALPSPPLRDYIKQHK